MGVPTTTPVVVRPDWFSSIFAMPKSARKSRSFLSTSTFAGFTSRCSTPAACGIERVGKLRDPCGRERERHGAGPQPLAQRPAGEVGHDEERHAVVLAKVVHGEDARMLERGHHARLAQEADR